MKKSIGLFLFLCLPLLAAPLFGPTISSSGGGSGSVPTGVGGYTQGHGVPSATPAVSPALYTDLDSGNLFYWDGSNWH